MERLYYNGQEYELTEKTMKIARLIEQAEASNTITEAYTKEFEFVKAAIGDNAVKEVLGTTNLETVNLNELVKLYSSIIDAYDKEILELRHKQEMETFNSPAFDTIRQLASDVKIISDIDKLGSAK